MASSVNLGCTTAVYCRGPGAPAPLPTSSKKMAGQGSCIFCPCDVPGRLDTCAYVHAIDGTAVAVVLPHMYDRRAMLSCSMLSSGIHIRETGQDWKTRKHARKVQLAETREQRVSCALLCAYRGIAKAAAPGRLGHYILALART